jgi:hypothetical protein
MHSPFLTDRLDSQKDTQRFGERQAATVVDCGTLLPACPLHL